MTVTFSHPSEIYAQTSHWRPTNDTSPTPGATPGPAARGLPVAAGAATASTATTASLGRGGSDTNLLVLLADVTDDLETDRRQVQRYLEQQQITVLPTQPYPLGRAEFELKLNADLGRAALFVQLLGARPG